MNKTYTYNNDRIGVKHYLKQINKLVNILLDKKILIRYVLNGIAPAIAKIKKVNVS